MMLRLPLIFLFMVMLMPAMAIGESDEWTQAQLNEDFMRSLTKHHCMVKTINSLRLCSTDKCIKTMGGVVGDCVTWASGDLGEFCASYDAKYLDKPCKPGDLNERACQMLKFGKEVICKKV